MYNLSCIFFLKALAIFTSMMLAVALSLVLTLSALALPGAARWAALAALIAAVAAAGSHKKKSKKYDLTGN